MPGCRWFEGMKLNYAENLLAGDPGRLAVVSCFEGASPDQAAALTLEELRRRVAACRSALESLGVRCGDRVAGYLANTVEALVAALACASLGAVWSSTSPDFGLQALSDRLRQVKPKIPVVPR